MSSRPFRTAFRLAFSASLLAAVAAALLDVLVTWVRTSEPVGAAALAGATLAALGLYGAAAAFVATLQATIAGSMWTTFDVGATLRQIVVYVTEDEAGDRVVAASLFALALAIGFVGFVVLGYDVAVGLKMAAKRNTALTTAMVAMLAVPLAVLAWFPLYLLSRRLSAPLPRPRSLWAVATILGLGLLMALAALFSVDWRVIDFGPVESLLLFFAFEAVALVLVCRAPLPRRALASGWSALGLAFVVTWFGFGKNPRAVAFAGEESMGQKVLLKTARRMSDGDGDGYALRLGGGDCNDDSPAVHPGADEIRGNGIDEDCDGSDAPIEAPHQATKVARSAALNAFKWKGNLLVITIDTLRADRITPAIAPHLHKLAQHAVHFTHAYAQAPNTPRSFPSFLTSHFPSEIRWRNPNANFSPRVESPDRPTLFSAIKSTGFYEVGVFSHFYLTRDNGIATGFDEWHNDGALSLHDSNTDSAAPRITPRVAAAIAKLGRGRQRWAVWTHLFEPHSRYMEHAEFPAHGGGLRGLEQKYDAEVSFTDKYIGEMLAALEKSGQAKNTAVVIFSDHGEAFGEHRFGGERMLFHGQTLYNELLRVPLIIYVPGLAPHTVDSSVMLVDLAPTLCDLVKAPIPTTMRGRSLLPALLGETLPPRPVYAELLPAPSWNHKWRAVVDGNLKLIQKLSENTVELYDLAKDRTEQHNLALSQPDEVTRLGKRIKSILDGELE